MSLSFKKKGSKVGREVSLEFESKTINLQTNTLTIELGTHWQEFMLFHLVE